MAFGGKMNISEAIFLNKVSPDSICKDLYTITLGFKEVEKENNRKVNYFDMFVLFAFYSYKPALEEFTNVQYNKYTTFKLRIERNPDIFANINGRFSDGIEFCKAAILYGLNNQYFDIDEYMNLIPKKIRGFKSDKRLINIGKTFSTKSSKELYKYFKVDINEI